MPDYADRRFWEFIDRRRIVGVLTRYRRALDRRDAGLTYAGLRHPGPRDE